MGHVVWIDYKLGNLFVGIHNKIIRRIDQEGCPNNDKYICPPYERLSLFHAMNVFAKAVVQRGRIPFEIKGDSAARSDEERKTVKKAIENED